MDVRGYEHYKDQAINTMTQGELLLMLYDELVKRLTRAEIALSQEDYGLMEASVERSIEIIRYLDRTLDRSYEVGRNLARMYDFFCYDLSRVRFGRNAEELKRVKGMVLELRESFRTAQQNAAAGK